jgi:hypothetical protein
MKNILQMLGWKGGGQQAPLPGEAMVANDAGGYAYALAVAAAAARRCREDDVGSAVRCDRLRPADAVGFDAVAPALIGDFVAGRL